MAWLDNLPLWLSFPLGLVALILGAELLVRGSARLAAAAGITPLVIGLTVVAFGTSAPELAVSVGASLAGEPAVAVGNVVGSNIMNVLLILGASALITPLVVHSRLVRLDVPLMILASIAAWLMSADGLVSRLEGTVLVLALAAYLGLIYFTSRRPGHGQRDEVDPELAELTTEPSRTLGATASNIGFIVIGLAALVVGARWLVSGATAMARWLEVSELVIGLTVIAIGTSLPEIATSLLATLRGQRDIAVGNVVGSNIFNLLCVLGLTAALPPTGVPVSSAAVYFDIPVMLAVSIVCMPIFFTGGRISRLEGGVLLAYFAAYNGYLILDAAGHDLAGPLSWVMLLFALPLTTIGIGGSVLLSLRIRRRRRTLGVSESRPG